MGVANSHSEDYHGQIQLPGQEYTIGGGDGTNVAVIPTYGFGYGAPAVILPLNTTPTGPGQTFVGTAPRPGFITANQPPQTHGNPGAYPQRAPMPAQVYPPNTSQYTANYQPNTTHYPSSTPHVYNTDHYPPNSIPYPYNQQNTIPYPPNIAPYPPNNQPNIAPYPPNNQPNIAPYPPNNQPNIAPYPPNNQPHTVPYPPSQSDLPPSYSEIVSSPVQPSAPPPQTEK